MGLGVLKTHMNGMRPNLDPHETVRMWPTKALHLQAFLGGEAGWEGAEEPRGGARASGKRAREREGGGDPGGVAFDAAGFWAELGTALGLPPGAAAAAGGWDSSDSNEGSSFFSDGGSGGEGGAGGARDLMNGDDEGEEEGYGFLAAVRRQRAAAAAGPSAAGSAAVADPNPTPSGAAGPELAGPMRPAAQPGSSSAATNPSSDPDPMSLHPGAGARGDERWEADTETDSDDERAGAADFDAAYGAALADQLGATRAGTTLVRDPVQYPTSDAGAGGGGQAQEGAGGAAGKRGGRAPGGTCSRWMWM